MPRSRPPSGWSRRRGAPRPTASGAFLVDGRMIDIPFIRHAEAILGAARRLGLDP
jgi:citrate lyase beta subunit